jgi:hypothetical protein
MIKKIIKFQIAASAGTISIVTFLAAYNNPDLRKNPLQFLKAIERSLRL